MEKESFRFFRKKKQINFSQTSMDVYLQQLIKINENNNEKTNLKKIKLNDKKYLHKKKSIICQINDLDSQ